jgi:hypothetical protein
MSKERAAQLVDAGIWLRLSGDIEGARRLFERALKLDPENQRAGDLLAQAPSTVVEPPVPEAGAAPPASSSGSGSSRDRPRAGPGTPVPTSPSGITEDWGRMTGRNSPLPQLTAPTPTPPALGDAPPGRTSVMYVPGLGLPTGVTPGSAVPSLGALGRQTIPYAGQPTPVPRQTMMFNAGPTAVPPQVAPARQTLPYGADALDTGRPPPIASSPTPRTSMMFSVPTPAPTPEQEEARSTQVYSGSSAGPMGPSQLGEVRPVVIRIEAADDLAEPDSLVESLRNQVNAEASRGPRPTSIVLTDNAPEPVTPPPTPPLFPESSDPPVLVRPAAPQPAAAFDAAWNWSASPPPAGRDQGFDEEAPEPRPSPGLSPQASSGWDQRGTPGIKIDDMVGPDNALEFVSSGSNPPRSPETDREEVETLVRGARDLIDLDDHTGAMELIARAQVLAPDDPQVQQLRERSERTLLAMFESKLGHLEKIPRVMLKDDEIIWLNLDHRAGFVLAQIDGTVSFEDLFAVSGMSRLDTARILAQLVDEGVINRG